MAEIPVEKKSGIPGWVWLLLALLLIGLLLWWLLDDDDEIETDRMDDVAVAQVEETTVPAATVAPFTIGESVDLDNVRVTELVGDMSFMGESEGREVFVVFNQVPTPSDATEGEYDINPGQTVEIAGRVMSAGEPMPEGVDATVPSGMEMYIFADTVSIADRP